MSLLDFAGKTVWVTGAGRGIGLEVANQFLSLGANVIGFDLAFDETSYEFECITLDISDEQRVKSLVDHALLKHPVLDVLVNAAGILRMASVEETSWQDFSDCINVNAGGAFLMIKHTMARFKQQRHGAIVTVSSNAAKVPRTNMMAYCASKAALSSISHTAGLELAPYGVRCNLVCPGSTDTPMQRQLWQDEKAEANTIKGFPEQYKLGIPLGKIAAPSDIAQVVLFFASSMANHITMQDVVVDGGATLNV
ncbi:2,3-dihydro-2,3-dihydroxybenzoate dehydrogenase [Marinomonas posidonica]|uniref:2,3-dihydro-2,3-dihydroxybenzoate dehydrogenase n=1 Tax=Marinomonas posidonica (strain CECT 7376 / NCIMB 14433 / IVIA-Po-181) TaxID=491952 RepID=F6CU81_MARPP|nr:2,3-dihydro-2,3-dihydroxybenzoate dehydrogenase [Marinomonas posidonica]AEF55200.1 2,3-dihydro-2,3-dihydroxybenzoate dehydrogenase [Marinomonas posidonica IVIA-Po-181]